MQIADRIMDGVESGEYPEGGRIPSVREFAARLEVNPNTMMRAYDWLQQKQLIFNRRGIGFFISDGCGKKIREIRENEFFSNEMEYFLRRLAGFGMTPDELRAKYEEYLANNRK